MTLSSSTTSTAGSFTLRSDITGELVHGQDIVDRRLLLPAAAAHDRVHRSTLSPLCGPAARPRSRSTPARTGSPAIADDHPVAYATGRCLMRRPQRVSDRTGITLPPAVRPVPARRHRARRHRARHHRARRHAGLGPLTVARHQPARRQPARSLPARRRPRTAAASACSAPAPAWPRVLGVRAGPAPAGRQACADRVQPTPYAGQPARRSPCPPSSRPVVSRRAVSLPAAATAAGLAATLGRLVLARLGPVRFVLAAFRLVRAGLV